MFWTGLRVFYSPQISKLCLSVKFSRCCLASVVLCVNHSHAYRHIYMTVPQDEARDQTMYFVTYRFLRLYVYPWLTCLPYKHAIVSLMQPGLWTQCRRSNNMNMGEGRRGGVSKTDFVKPFTKCLSQETADCEEPAPCGRVRQRRWCSCCWAWTCRSAAPQGRRDVRRQNQSQRKWRGRTSL